MPKFTVILTRDITESCVVEVEAADADAAEYVAIDQYVQGLITHDRWSIDDNEPDDPYVTDVEKV